MEYPGPKLIGDHVAHRIWSRPDRLAGPPWTVKREWPCGSLNSACLCCPVLPGARRSPHPRRRQLAYSLPRSSTRQFCHVLVIRTPLFAHLAHESVPRQTRLFLATQIAYRSVAPLAAFRRSLAKSPVEPVRRLSTNGWPSLLAGELGRSADLLDLPVPGSMGPVVHPCKI